MVCLKKIFFVFLCLLGIFSCPQGIEAHPHVFVEPELTLVFDAQGLAGIKHVWFFDEMFSAMILEDYDVDDSMEFNTSEIAAIQEGAFHNIAEWGYFTYFKKDNTNIPVQKIQDFTAKIQDGSVLYEFFIPYQIPCGTHVSIAVFDPDYYVDFLPPIQESVHLEGAAQYLVHIAIHEEPEAILNDWMITPTVIHVDFTKK